jgi:DNA polymerase-1
MAWNIELPDTKFFIGPTGNRYKQADQQLVKQAGSAEFHNLVNELSDQKVIGIDTETTGLISWKDVPLYWSVAWGQSRATLRSDTLDCFTHLFAKEDVTWVFANAKYDMHILANFGIYLRGKCVDTQVMHALLYEDRQHKLKMMADHLFGWSWASFEDAFGKIGTRLGEERTELLREACDHMGPCPYGIDSNRLSTPWDLIRIAEWHNLALLIEYAANDAWGTLLCYIELKRQLEAAGTHSLYPQYISTVWDYFDKVEKPYTKVLWKAERRGVLLDQQRLASAAPEAKETIGRIERDIVHAAGRMINPASPKQLREYFIDQEKLAPVKMSKGGKTGVRQASVDKDFLEKYKNDHPVASLILEHRRYAKLYGTYIEGLSSILDPWGRIHTHFNQDVARTGRLSSSDPNLQNIPRPENDHWNLRAGFITLPGWKIIAADYSQLEMRLLAAASCAEGMIDVFLRNWDIHCGNAALMYDIEYTDIVAGNELKKKIADMPEQDLIQKAEEISPGILGRCAGDIKYYLKYCAACRSDAKNIGFGLNYGMGPNKLANDLGCSVKDAQLKIRTYKDTYPAVENFMKEAVEEARQYGYSFTILGRRRSLPMILSSRKDEKALGERLAVNTQIQGSAADTCKMAQLQLDWYDVEAKYNCFAVLQVHDELVFEVPEEHAEPAKRDIEELMAHPFWTDLRVPLIAEAGIGNNWAEAK